MYSSRVVPLFLYLGYSLSVAVARISGWRLILPVDWIAIVYYCVGLTQIVLWGMAIINNKKIVKVELQESISTSSNSKKENGLYYGQTIGIGVMFLAIGISVPLAELLFPHKYAPVTIESVKEILGEYGGTDYFEAGIENFLGGDFAIATTGRMLYPRYYLAHEFEPGSNFIAETLRINRLVFFLAGSVSEKVLMPLSDPTINVVNASDVLVIGCN